MMQYSDRGLAGETMGKWSLWLAPGSSTTLWNVAQFVIKLLVPASTEASSGNSESPLRLNLGARRAASRRLASRERRICAGFSNSQGSKYKRRAVYVPACSFE